MQRRGKRGSPAYSEDAEGLKQSKGGGKERKENKRRTVELFPSTERALPLPHLYCYRAALISGTLLPTKSLGDPSSASRWVWLLSLALFFPVLLVTSPTRPRPRSRPISSLLSLFHQSCCISAYPISADEDVTHSSRE